MGRALATSGQSVHGVTKGSARAGQCPAGLDHVLSTSMGLVPTRSAHTWAPTIRATRTPDKHPSLPRPRSCSWAEPWANTPRPRLTVKGKHTQPSGGQTRKLAIDRRSASFVMEPKRSNSRCRQLCHLTSLRNVNKDLVFYGNLKHDKWLLVHIILALNHGCPHLTICFKFIQATATMFTSTVVNLNRSNYQYSTGGFII